MRTSLILSTLTTGLQIEVNPSKNVVHLMNQPRGQLGIQFVRYAFENDFGLWIFTVQFGKAKNKGF
ncbi:MAG: hypothetical protein EBS96_02640 [Spartobacteria bacterium]|nr:hypothetical protein [Spartobacteria bacterium]